MTFIQPVSYQPTVSRPELPLHAGDAQGAEQPNNKILVIEEKSAHQTRLAQGLQQLDYVSDTANNLQEATSACSQSAYSAILVDWQLLMADQSDAISFMQALEESSKRQLQPAVIIAMIAHYWQEHPEWSTVIKVDARISKPIQQEVLAAMLKHWSQIHASTYQAPDEIQHIANFKPGFSDLQLDWDHLHQISDHNPEFELELLQLFVEDSYAHLALLQAAIAKQNFQQIEQEAHHIKGASANVGATPMELIASQLEQQARQQQLQATNSFLMELEQFLFSLKGFIISQQV